jgi:hypothetical protein
MNNSTEKHSFFQIDEDQRPSVHLGDELQRRIMTSDPGSWIIAPAQIRIA